MKNDLPQLEKIIVLDSNAALQADEIPFAAVQEKGMHYLKAYEKEFADRWQSIHESDPANICYTSGTTADPKGIILTHRNYTANTEQASAILIIPEYYCSLLILPWDHCFAHTAGIYTLMSNGASMASVQVGKTAMETLKNIPVNIKETRPHFLLSVPSLAKNFRKNIEKGIREKGAKIEKLFCHALEAAYAYNGIGWDKGKNASLAKKLEYKLYDILLFKKVTGEFRRASGIFYRRRGIARYRTAAIFLCSRYSDAAGIRIDGIRACYFRQCSAAAQARFFRKHRAEFTG